MSMDLCRRAAGDLGPTLSAGQMVSCQDAEDDADGAAAWEEEQTALEAIFGAEVSFPTCRSCCLAIRADQVRAQQGYHVCVACCQCQCCALQQVKKLSSLAGVAAWPLSKGEVRVSQGLPPLAGCTA